MYFTNTPELRKLEREMRQKPNFDRCNDEENRNTHLSVIRNSDPDRKKKEVE